MKFLDSKNSAINPMLDKRLTDGQREHFKNQRELTPQLTQIGFEKTKLEDDTFSKVLDYYNESKDKFIKENVESESNPYIWRSGSKTDDKWPAWIALNHKFQEWLVDSLQIEHEKWCGFKLEPSMSYGFRKYTRGATLTNHVDRYETHVISSIINVDQKVDTPWLLWIEDYDSEIHKISMNPGDMLFYESAKLIHGRPDPLDGDYYVSVFNHYKPEGWYVSGL